MLNLVKEEIKNICDKEFLSYRIADPSSVTIAWEGEKYHLEGASNLGRTICKI
jgi:hypothetical protein